MYLVYVHVFLVIIVICPSLDAAVFSAEMHAEYLGKSFKCISKLQVDDACKAQFICAEDIFWSRREKQRVLIMNWARDSKVDNLYYYKNAIVKYEEVLKNCSNSKLSSIVNYRLAWCKRNYRGDYRKNIDSIIANSKVDKQIYNKTLALKSLSRRNAVKAWGFSLLVPGSGQFYCGSYLEGAIHSLLTIGAYGMLNDYASKGEAVKGLLITQVVFCHLYSASNAVVKAMRSNEEDELDFIQEYGDVMD